ncbi:MAG: hypothetical protein IPK79_11355 [Vampirovibrionales bacterium]|nr:hypothetical protein [Vampirovibrionales bacterium]
MFDQTLSAFQVESLPEYDAVKARFLDSFEPYANALRQSAVEAALLEEFGPRPLCANADFIARIQASLGCSFGGAQRIGLIATNREYLGGSN